MSSVQCIGEIIANNNVQKEGTEYWNSIEKSLKSKFRESISPLRGNKYELTLAWKQLRGFYRRIRDIGSERWGLSARQ